MDTVFCPLCNIEVDGITCMEVSTHAEGMGPKNCYPSGVDITWADEHPEICLKCMYHPA